MVKTHQSSPTSTVEYYSNRTEAAAPAAYEKDGAERATAEKATATAHAAATDFVSLIAFHHEITHVPAAPDYPSSSDEDGPPPLSQTPRQTMITRSSTKMTPISTRGPTKRTRKTAPNIPSLQAPNRKTETIWTPLAMPVQTHPLKKPSTRSSTG